MYSSSSQSILKAGGTDNKIGFRAGGYNRFPEYKSGNVIGKHSLIVNAKQARQHQSAKEYKGTNGIFARFPPGRSSRQGLS